MARKLPSDAFAHYLSLGESRSYAAVAKHFGVNRATVVRRASKEEWQYKLRNAERDARDVVAQKLGATLAEMEERHLAVLKLVLAKGIEAIRNMSLNSPRDALAAIDLALSTEREMLTGEKDRSLTVVIE